MDTDGDRDVDGLDVLTCAAAHGSVAGEAAYVSACDANQDERIDEADIAVLCAGFAAGQCR